MVWTPFSGCIGCRETRRVSEIAVQRDDLRRTSEIIDNGSEIIDNRPFNIGNVPVLVRALNGDVLFGPGELSEAPTATKLRRALRAERNSLSQYELQLLHENVVLQDDKILANDSTGPIEVTCIRVPRQKVQIHRAGQIGIHHVRVTVVPTDPLPIGTDEQFLRGNGEVMGMYRIDECDGATLLKRLGERQTGTATLVTREELTNVLQDVANVRYTAWDTLRDGASWWGIRAVADGHRISMEGYGRA